jgi:hypothetical protein
MKFDPENVIERAVTKLLPLSELKLDPENVRLKHLKKALSQEEIEDYFWNQKATNELLAQIKAARGLYQDPIVTPEGIVKEGNRRLVCLRKLQKQAHAGELQDISPTLFDNVKCTVLPANATDEEISLLLATIHVRGKKAWDSFNKAEMLAHLHKDLDVSYDSLSKELGMSKMTLIRLIKAHDVTIQYSEKYPEDSDWYNNFAILEELFKRRDLKDWRDKPANLILFFSWIHEKKLFNHKQVRDLYKILNEKTASRIFEEEDFDKAIDYLNSVDPTIEDSDFRKISHTIKTLRSFDRKAIVKIINDPARMKMLQNLRYEINSLLRDVLALEMVNRKRKEEV